MNRCWIEVLVSYTRGRFGLICLLSSMCAYVFLIEVYVRNVVNLYLSDYLLSVLCTASVFCCCGDIDLV